jgi:REP-associated tyrosine transposase
MSDYRRALVPGGTFFFTVVTHRRQPILTHPACRQYLRTAFREVQLARPFDVDAIVLLPEHLHCVWSLPPDDADFPTRWRQIKKRFTQQYLDAGFVETNVSSGRARQGDRGVWHRRYYEHAVRDDLDLKRSVDYLHLNPVKHRLVKRVRDWPWSSFHRFVRLGEYSIQWGGSPELYGDEWKRFE